jgi:hypothetical protein
MVAHANAAINPCLYLIFNQNFRDGLKHIFNKVKMDYYCIERFHVTSSPPCWCPMNKRFLISVHC